MQSRWVRERLERAPPAAFALYCMVAAFSTYFCMYAFRKPFSVGMYEEQQWLGVDYKILLVITQVIGYTLSKFTGIKVVSEMTPGRRIAAILLLIGAAEVALVLFGWVPPPYNLVCLFLNGLPLGMIWGIVFSFLEGRRFTELLGAGLCTSFIVSSGVVKSAGKSLMVNHGVPEYWMPAATGALFILPLLGSVWLLAQIPPPSQQDENQRSRRETMDRRQRREFFAALAPGLVLLVTIYAILNGYRDFRDNFAVELWTGLGHGDAPAIFTLSEIPIAILVMVSVGVMIWIRNNDRAFFASLLSIILGGLMVGLTTWGYTVGVVNPTLWLITVGLGMYIPYIAFHVMVFERLIALFRSHANVGFLMYVCDTVGYVVSVGIMLYKNFGSPELSYVEFFVDASYVAALSILVLSFGALWYFRKRIRTTDSTIITASTGTTP